MSQGGGALILDGNPTFTNNTIADNAIITTAEYAGGGGLYVVDGLGSAGGVNNILYGNTGHQYPHYYGNVSFTYSCVEEGMTGEGNISDDPCFLDPVNDDYHLQEGSPCINTGDPSSPLDPDSTRADMGAFYYPVNATSDDREISIPAEFMLFGCYPNPFNAVTTISFSMPIVSQTSVRVYDLEGSLITEILTGWNSAGRHEVTFDASGLASGIYLYQIIGGSFTDTAKMVLLK